MSPLARARAHWDAIHQYCDDDPPPIESLDQARRVLDVHGNHPSSCRQRAAAMKWPFEPWGDVR